MIPLVALVPLPRLDLLDTILQRDLVPASFLEAGDGVKAPDGDSTGLENPAHSVVASDLHDRLAGTAEWLPRSLTVIDLVCVTTGLAWLLLGFWGVRWLIRHSRAPSASTQAIFDRLFAGDLKRRNWPALRVSARVQHPVVVGLFRPTILLPSGFDEPGGDPELLRLSLLHELAHADRRDPWFGAVASLAQTVWFFLPQIWWLRSQLLIDQEFLADRSAALRYGTSSGYAASLLSLAGPRSGVAAENRQSDLASNVGAVARSSVQSQLAQRVLMLLYCPFRFEASAPRSWSWILRIALVSASLIAACLCIRWPHAAALEHRLKQGASHSRRAFRVTDFTSAPMVISKGGRALSYVMPVGAAAPISAYGRGALRSPPDWERCESPGIHWHRQRLPAPTPQESEFPRTPANHGIRSNSSACAARFHSRSTENRCR